MDKTYKTISGDTLDIISYKIYGTEFNVYELVAANPEHANTVIFSGDITLNIPDVEPPVLNEHLPPWRR